ncbi:reverse transcriptase domain-containing protein [Tanacetum coccineum]
MSVGNNAEDDFVAILPEYTMVDRQDDYDEKEYFVKWVGLNYDECYWESELDILSFQQQIKNFNRLQSRNQKLRKQRSNMRDSTDLKKKSKEFQQFEKSPEFLPRGELHPYQLEGLNFLRFSWSKQTHVILANEIGLENHHFSCSSTRSSIQVIWRPDPTKDFDTTKPDTNFVLTSGAIRGTLTQPRFSKKLTMSTHEQITNNPTSAVRNTGGRNGPQGLEEPMSDEVLREMCDKNYHQLLPLIAEKMQKEKEQKDKLNANPEEGTEAGIPEAHHHTPVFSKGLRSTDPLHRGSGHGKKEACLIGWEERIQLHPSRTTSQYSESEDSERGHWKSKSRRQRSNTYEDDLSQPWTCEERNPFTPRIRHFSLTRTRMPSHVKIYDGSGDPEDHLKLFQSAAKTEGWAMPTWCHMFNSTLTGNARVWFDKLPKESIDSYEDLRTAFRENYLQQTKH